MRDHWPLTGRDDESNVIAELLAGDQYRGVTLAGRAGVGKSRLAREVATAAAVQGWTVRHVAATATGRSVPLGAFASWTDDFDGGPLTLARRVISALTAGTDPGRLLVLVDDAHLLDELSALVLHQLVLQSTTRVIITIRTGVAAPDAVTVLWKDSLLRRLELQPLSRRESDELLHAVLAVPPDHDCSARMWQLTEGNVLFLRQLVEQEWAAGRLTHENGCTRWIGSPQVSPSLIDLVEHQIGAVPEMVRDVVDLVAVAEPIDHACLTALVDPLALEEAQQRELIRTADTGDAVYVGHPLYAEVRLEQCGAIRLRRLRGVVAKAMKDAAGEANSVRRGLLWLESDLPPDPTVLAAAASAASSLLEFGLAERLSRAATDAGAAVETRVELAYNLLMLQKGEDAEQVLDSIAGESVPTSNFINDVILRAANLLWSQQSPEQSWQVIDDALVGATGERACQLWAFRANQLALAGRPGEVPAAMARVDYESLDAFGSTIGLCAETLALAELGQTAGAVAKATKCYTVVDASPQSSFLGQPLAEFHTFALSMAGYIDEAVEVAGAHLRRSQERPATAQSVATAIVGFAALAAGDLQAARAHLAVRPIDADANFVLANSYYRFQLLLAQTLARMGDLPGAEAAFRTAREHRRPAYVYVESSALLAEAWIAAGHQRMDDARRKAWAAAQFARDHEQFARELMCLQTAVQFGDTTAADRLTELAEIVEGPRAGLTARYARAVCTDNADELDVLSTAFEAMGDRLAAADCSGHAAAAHRRADRRGSALTSAERAGRLAAACGGAVSPAIVGARLPAPFTQREREIAVLVAQGLSNRQIADTMSLSVRTVEGHVYRASCKAGVTRRSELAHVVRNLTDPAPARL